MAQDGVRVVVVRNDLARIAVELAAARAEIVADTANKIEESWKRGVSTRIASTLRTEWGAGRKSATVSAGDKRRAIHAGFVEFGTAHTPGAPAAVPAAEGARPGFMSAMRDLEPRLKV
jgi:HK97 gp10 family phage protein